MTAPLKKLPKPRARRDAASAGRAASARAAAAPRKSGKKRSSVAATVTPARLMAEAERARRQAYAPYSRFRVGAALLTKSGEIVHGCNVENASLGLSICAERNAVWKAVSQGMREFVAIAVTAEPGHGASPCGGCRQVLQEFAPDISVYWRNGAEGITCSKLDELLARPFKLYRNRG